MDYSWFEIRFAVNGKVKKEFVRATSFRDAHRQAEMLRDDSILAIEETTPFKMVFSKLF